MYKIDSQELAKCIDRFCKNSDLTKKDFHKQSGISSATLTQWRQGVIVSTKSIERLEEYTGMAIDEFIETYSSSRMVIANDDVIEIREALRDRPEMKILFSAAKDVPASTILETAAQLMRFKEESK